MRRAVDVVHGRALIAARPGHAWGRYDADVSDHVLAWVLGREGEPFSVHAYNRRPHGRRSYQGRFLAVARGTPADVWLGGQCDELLQNEWDVYHAQRPIGYTNWPPLDPLRHATGSSRAAEQALRRRYGFPPNPRLKEDDNEGAVLDARLEGAAQRVPSRGGAPGGGSRGRERVRVARRVFKAPLGDDRSRAPRRAAPPV